MFTSGAVTQRLFALLGVRSLLYDAREVGRLFVCRLASLDYPLRRSKVTLKKQKKGNLSKQNTVLMKDERTYDMPNTRGI